MSAARARPLVLYAVQTQRTGDYLDTLSQSGDAVRVAPMEIAGVRALTIGPSNQQLTGALAVNHGTQIVRVDASSGHCYSSPPFPLRDVTAMAFRCPDTLICGTSTGNVYRVLPATSEVALLGSRPEIAFSGFVTNPGSSRIWATAGSPPSNDTLYSIDTRTGTVLPVGRTGFDVRTNALCAAPDGGLYGLVESSLVLVDTATGKRTFVALYPVEGLCANALRTDTLATDIAEVRAPPSVALLQNYPNPFNPRTSIGYVLPFRAFVTVKVFNMLGQEVATLVAAEQPAGTHRTE